jgi:hypothetical protein
MIKTVDQYSCGISTESVMRLLDTIYKKQRAEILRNGDATSVDWMEEMALSGQRLIIHSL